jgi:ferredoxin
MARCSIGRAAVLLVLMAAAQCLTFSLALSQGVTSWGFSLEMVVQNSGMRWIFAAALAVLTLLLCMTGFETRGKQGYTLMRLSVSPRWVFAWQSVYNTACYVILWLVQVLVAAGLCALYVRQAPADYVSGQTVVLAFYRSDFLHALLPFESVGIWVRDLALCIGLGICAARCPVGRRQGGKFFEVIPLAAAAVLFFPCALTDGEGYVITVLWAALWAAVSLYRTCRKEAACES